MSTAHPHLTKPLFNSLGSNYSTGFIRSSWRLLWPWPRRVREAQQRLETTIAKYWPGQVVLVHKGRDAIELALRAHGIGQGDAVLMQTFTCVAIEEAIHRVNAEPVFVDMGDELHLSVATLEAALAAAPTARALLLQHTLGWPSDPRMVAWAKRKKLLVICDLAQAAGALNPDGSLLGTDADVVILSFGRDKVIDAVTGGAVVFLTPPPHQLPELKLVPLRFVLRDLVYPVVTWLIRTTYRWANLGKVVHLVAKTAHLLTSPVASPVPEARAMPAAIVPLVQWQFAEWSTSLSHRRAVAQVYRQVLQATSLVPKKITAEYINQAAPVRFPIQVAAPVELGQWLARQQIFLTDRWYRAAVDAGQVATPSVYHPGSCPRAEAAAKQMFNLPTHRGISVAQAKILAELVLTAPPAILGKGAV